MNIHHKIAELYPNVRLVMPQESNTYFVVYDNPAPQAPEHRYIGKLFDADALEALPHTIRGASVSKVLQYFNNRQKPSVIA